MPERTWREAVEAIEPSVIRVLTPYGSGSGFLAARSREGNLVGIATAARVIAAAHFSQQTIRLQYGGSTNKLPLSPADRAVLLDPGQDTAVIVAPGSTVPLPDLALPIAPGQAPLKPGTDIAWMGYPSIPDSGLCCFGGEVTGWIRGCYLVSGIPISGMVGGPAFYLGAAGPVLLGVMTLYAASGVTEASVAGLSAVRVISAWHDLVDQLRSLDEAKAQEARPGQLEQTPPMARTPPPVLAGRTLAARAAKR